MDQRVQDQSMTDVDTSQTMREWFENNGYDTDSLVHPRDVQPEDIVEGTKVVADTTVRNPDPDAPATTRDIVEYDVGPDDVYDPAEVVNVTDGAVSYPETTPARGAVHWAFQGGRMAFISIGYGEAMYGENDDFADPNRWERLLSQVWGQPDDYFRFKFPDE